MSGALRRDCLGNPAPASRQRAEDPLWYRFAAGSLGELFATSFTHPADVLKVRLQLSGELNSARRSLTARDFMITARGLILTEGLRHGLYAGISASWMRQFVFSGLRHGGYGVLERSWRAESGAIEILGRIACAAVAGGLAAVVANPTDVVLIRMQADGHWPEAQRRNYRHVFDGLRQITQDEGPRTLWRGCGPTVARAILVTTSQIGTYEEVKSLLLRAGHPDALPVHMTSAISSATVACMVTSPVDVVKTRIMNMQRAHGVNYKGPLDVVCQALRTEGPWAFFKGLSATFLRLWPHTLLLWIGQERVTEFLRRKES